MMTLRMGRPLDILSVSHTTAPKISTHYKTLTDFNFDKVARTFLSELLAVNKTPLDPIPAIINHLLSMGYIAPLPTI